MRTIQRVVVGARRSCLAPLYAQTRSHRRRLRQPAGPGHRSSYGDRLDRFRRPRHQRRRRRRPLRALPRSGRRPVRSRRVRLNRERGRAGSSTSRPITSAGEDQRYRGDIVKPGQVQGLVPVGSDPDADEPHDADAVHRRRPGVLRDRQCASGAGAGARPTAMAPVFDQFARRSRPRRAGTSPRAASSTSPTPELTVNAHVRHTDRDGAIPYGGSFGHSSLVEMPAPDPAHVDRRRRRRRVHARSGAAARRLHRVLVPQRRHRRDVRQSVPRRSTAVGDSSRGRLTLAPSNSFIGVNGLGVREAAVPLPRDARTSRSAGSRTPAIRSCRRRSIGADARRRSTARPWTARRGRRRSTSRSSPGRPATSTSTSAIRDYDYDNRTPEFAMTQRVSYDNSASRPPTARWAHRRPPVVLSRHRAVRRRAGHVRRRLQD